MNIGTSDPLWTVVAEYEGCTYVSQCHAEAVEDACVLWISSEHDWLPSQPDGDYLDMPEPLEHSANVWCASILTRDEDMILLHLIRTATPS
ncbi:hypothetical protein [Mesobacterium pallidum]|uniref:hypothetical protein n=1 Tax=Mesobacterium pallidum TaxID=2872037 RepID=UPI001EE1A709|nr:hypothetical protein [Mesobacterium pallidum]